MPHEKSRWYFRLSFHPSPTSDLARFGRFSQKLEIRYRPVLFAGLLNHWEQKGPGRFRPSASGTFGWCHLVGPSRASDGWAAPPINRMPYLAATRCTSGKVQTRLGGSPPGLSVPSV